MPCFSFTLAKVYTGVVVYGIRKREEEKKRETITTPNPISHVKVERIAITNVSAVQAM